MNTFHAFTIAAIRSGEGKTTISLGLMRLLSRTLTTQAFKCGPDYIDPTFHELVTNRPCYNLDTWIMGKDEVKRIFTEHSQEADCAICEGVMGLFDGKIQKLNPENNQCDILPSLEGSSAHIAQLLDIPIILVINAKGMASSIAPLVEGFTTHCKKYNLKLAGIIANNVGSTRHADILKQALEVWQLPPLIGYLPRKAEWSVDDRQLGLVPLAESKKDLAWADAIADTLEESIDINLLLKCTKVENKNSPTTSNNIVKPFVNKTLAIAKDKAFCFYYHENLKALEKLGWTLKYFSPLCDSELPSCNAVYFGGGYPEIFAKELSQNTSMLASMKEFAENNGEIFAECGGYMYLMKEIHLPKENSTYQLCNVIQGKATMGAKLRSLGYREMQIHATTIFVNNLEERNIFRGHEFHWSDIELHEEYKPFATIDNTKHGIIYKNVKASYLHFYWAN